MNVSIFLKKNNIKPADSIVVKKLQFGILKHYIIYLGFIQGDHRFIANYNTGIDIIPNDQLHKFLNIYQPIELNPFRGNEYQRQEALERAWSRRGEKEYNLILNNCEHYYSFVHTGVPRSKQVQDFGAGLIAAGAITATASAIDGNKKGVWGGLILAGLGLLTLSNDKEK